MFNNEGRIYVFCLTHSLDTVMSHKIIRVSLCHYCLFSQIQHRMDVDNIRAIAISNVAKRLKDLVYNLIL